MLNPFLRSSWKPLLLSVNLIVCSACATGPVKDSDGRRNSVAAVGGTPAQSNAGTLAPAAGSPTPADAGMVLKQPVVPAAVGSASKPPGTDACVSVQAEAKVQLRPSDIIWAIDSSPSMTSSFAAIQTALNTFSDKIVAAGIDAHIVLLAGAGLCVPAPLGSGAACVGADFAGFGGPPVKVEDSKDPAFLHLDTPFGANLGMTVILDNFEYYKHMLRADSHVQFVLTEDGSPFATAAQVEDHIEGRASATGMPAWMPPLREASYTWNGVICSGPPCSRGSGPATTIALIDKSKGIRADLGLAGQPGADPFATLLDELARAVVQGAMISCDYEIPPAPGGETLDRDMVNVVYTGQAGETVYPRVAGKEKCQDRAGWFYDDPANPTKIMLCESACTTVKQDLNAKIRVGFGCNTVVAPD